jgi:glutathione peroxidase
LNALQTAYEDLEVLGFPCNQFGLQEPGGTGEEILNGIRHVRPGNDFKPKIKLLRKIDVNGKNEHPLYTFLKKHCPPTRDFYAAAERLQYKPIRVNDVRWNFEKFLINRQGKPVYRYDAGTHAVDMQKDIEYLLSLP